MLKYTDPFPKSRSQNIYEEETETTVSMTLPAGVPPLHMKEKNYIRIFVVRTWPLAAVSAFR